MLNSRTNYIIGKKKIVRHIDFENGKAHKCVSSILEIINIFNTK